MKNQIVLISGGTGGIGKEAALGIAKLGATVVVVGRSAERGAAAVGEIVAATGSRAEFMQADMSSQAEIQRLADEFKRRYSRLDVLVNNVGSLFTRRAKTVDGIEQTFALNHMSSFLLTDLLLDMLKASAPARIINVSSDAHQMVSGLKLDDIQFQRGFFNGWKAYGQSKLANILFTKELARRLQGSGVSANAMHPGFVASDFGKNNGILMNVAMLLSRPMQRSARKGAETIVYLASAPDLQGVSGYYYYDNVAQRSSDASYDEEAGRRLWEISEQLVRVSAFS